MLLTHFSHSTISLIISSYLQAASWTKVASVTEVKEAGGRKVVEVDDTQILVAESAGKFYAVANKCAHMGISLVGKTALLQGKVEGGCITCPAHGSKFDLATGEPQGEWCPNMPNVPFVGKALKGEKKSQPTYESRVGDNGVIEVLA